MKTLCQLRGGSHLYGLETPTSDVDLRGVFMNTDVSTVIGLDRYEHQDIKENGKDEFYFEIRHFLNLLRKTNTQVVEILFAGLHNFQILDPQFLHLILDRKEQFLDSVQFYKSLRGYIQGERRLANGERTGNLGGKRKAALDKYGFSPKNFVQLIRLCHCGITFFERGFYPVNVLQSSPALHSLLMSIKTTPEKYKKEDLNVIVDQYEARLVNVFEKRDWSDDFVFNKDYANEVLLELYYPVLTEELYAKHSSTDIEQNDIAEPSEFFLDGTSKVFDDRS